MELILLLYVVILISKLELENNFQKHGRFQNFETFSKPRQVSGL
jgi:hypothetical protein